MRVGACSDVEKQGEEKERDRQRQLETDRDCDTTCINLSSCLIPRLTARWCPMLFPSPCSRLAVFRSSLLFLCHWMSFMFLLYDRSICIHSLDLLFLTAGEFST